MKSLELRSIVLNFKSEKKSYTEIANLLNISRNEVINLCNYMPKESKLKRGPKYKIQKSEKLCIKRKIASLQNIQQRITSNKLKKECDLSVSSRTIRRHINSMNMSYKKIPSIICLSKNDKVKRLNQVKEWISLNHPWEKTIFTDEKRFSLDGPDDWRTFIRNDTKSYRMKRQSGGGGVMVWMMVQPNGLLSYHFINGKIKSTDYINLMKNKILPIIFLNYGRDFYLQQDNAPIHASKESMAFFKNSEIPILKWPARSPDLNIVEDMWKHISEAVYNGPQYRTKEQLREAIKKAVYEINSNKRNIIFDLYHGFRKRLCCVIEKCGCLYNK